MLTEEQRRRHNKRFTKAFGRCRVTWNNDRAHVRPRGREFRDHACWLYRKGMEWVLELATSDVTFKGPDLKPLADQLRLVALLDS